MGVSYDIYERLGSGTFGCVFRAKDLQGRVVAIKMIDVDTDCEIQDVVTEMKMLSELRCKQIVEYHKAFLHETQVWLVMEYCAAGPCSAMLKEFGPFAEDSAVWVLRETLRGLAYIHAQSKIHRDLKPANILVTVSGGIKIADFGVSAQLTHTAPNRLSCMGTPYWMAPEVIAQDSYRTAVDIWSIGIIGIELVAGEPPLRRLAPSKAMLYITKNSPPTIPERVFKENPVSHHYVKYVTACLEKDGDKRPTAKALLNLKLFRRASEYPPASFMKMVQRQLGRSAADVRPVSMVADVPYSDADSLSDFVFDNEPDVHMDCSDKEMVDGSPVPAASPGVTPQQRNSVAAAAAVAAPGVSGVRQVAIHRDPSDPWNRRDKAARPEQHKARQPLRQIVPGGPTRITGRGAEVSAVKEQTPAACNAMPGQRNSTVFTCFVGKPMLEVAARAHRPQTRNLVTRLYNEFAAIDMAMPGFSQAFMEEVYLAMREQQEEQQRRQKPGLVKDSRL